MEIFQFKYIDDVILREPEVRLSTTTFEMLKWFSQELTEFWMDKPKDKERIYSGDNTFVIEWFAGINCIIYGRKFSFTSTRQRSGKTGICDCKMIQFMPANHSNTNRVITILIHSDKKLFSKRFRYVATSRC